MFYTDHFQLIAHDKFVIHVTADDDIVAVREYPGAVQYLSDGSLYSFYVSSFALVFDGDLERFGHAYRHAFGDLVIRGDAEQIA